MEKCTYCVQRINNARIDAEKQNRPIRDGEIVTACESACPTEAIAFGNINDPNSKVAKLKAQQRHYTLLGELNSRPRTTYLGAVRIRTRSWKRHERNAEFAAGARAGNRGLRPGHTYASVTDKICVGGADAALGIGWLAGFALAFSIVMVLNLAIGWLIIQGVGIWGINVSDRVGLCNRQLRLVDRNRPRRDLISAILYLLNQKWRTSINRFAESDDAVCSRLRGPLSVDPYRASVDGVLHVPIPKHDGNLAAVPQPLDLGRFWRSRRTERFR